MEVNANIATTIARDIRNDKIPIAFAFYFRIQTQQNKDVDEKYQPSNGLPFLVSTFGRED